jgi:uncharacterized membrane protein (UPF0127 family)
MAVASANSALAEAVPQEILLPREALTIKTDAGSFKFEVEIADEVHERSTGLMFREKMAPTHGMLFDFQREAPVTMWMKNTILPLDMVFIRKNGTVLRIAKNTTPFSRDFITSGGDITHVLELNAGMANQIGLKPEDQIEHRFFKAE